METELVEGRELHRYFGVELNNETWACSSRSTRPARVEEPAVAISAERDREVLRDELAEVAWFGLIS